MECHSLGLELVPRLAASSLTKLLAVNFEFITLIWDKASWYMQVRKSTEKYSNGLVKPIHSVLRFTTFLCG
jgi:hypothetical protein